MKSPNAVLLAHVMLSWCTLILWLVILAASLIAIAVNFLPGWSRGSVTPADLPGIPNLRGQFSRWMETLGDTAAEIDMELILYGLLTVIGSLLILRAVVSAVVVMRHRKYAVLPETGSMQHAEPDMTRHWGMLGRGLTGKMVVAFSGTLVLFGFCTAAVVYFTLTNSLREHQLKYATLIARLASDTAASYTAAQKPAEIGALLRKSAGSAGMAYIVVDDGKGAVAAHSRPTVPDASQTASDRQPPRQTQQRTINVGGRVVYETAVPLLDGGAGAVRVGFWANEVEAEIRRAMAPVILGILAILAGGLACSTYLVWQINRPIVKLVRIASHISRGELDVPLSGTRDSGEFGELSRALERMRSSVKAAMARLN